MILDFPTGTVNVTEISDENFDLDVLMQRIRSEVEKRRCVNQRATLGAGASDGRRVADEGAHDALQLDRVEEASVPFEAKDRYSVHDFLPYHDEEFLTRVYRGVLRRPPDGTGFASFLGQLRGGSLSKVEALGRIRYSTEGRAAQVPVAGLAPRFAVRSMRRIPLLGRIVAIAQYLVRLPELAGNCERLEAAVFQRDGALRRQMDRNSALVERSVNAVIEQSAVRSAKTRDDLARVEQQIGALESRARESQAAVDALHGDVSNKADSTELAHLALLVGRKAERQALAELSDRMATPSAGTDPRFDAFYLKLEDRFRGSREDIRGRVEIYIPLVAGAGAGTQRRPIVDLGCGRGEWIEAIAAHGLSGYGVDANPVMVADCAQRGQRAVQADALDHLRSLPTSSVGAITSMHVVEHMAFSRLLAVVEESLRVLNPGGVLILETPNPENLLVGAGRFYIDPTHQRPIPPPLLQFVAEHLGFVDVEVLRLHPMQQDEWFAHASPERQRLNDLLFGAQDYAVVARKPGAVEDEPEPPREAL
ncbi:MAG TPA: methyltransferase domain-containing protein [Casimicrobiaceae bacterium]|nr:methyltransferase domain-containing protein [Casimicrobiaceae bacterium]